MKTNTIRILQRQNWSHHQDPSQNKPTPHGRQANSWAACSFQSPHLNIERAQRLTSEHKSYELGTISCQRNSPVSNGDGTGSCGLRHQGHEHSSVTLLLNIICKHFILNENKKNICLT
ncbi:unnamed protein product [Amaranthus hypochondriacus]